MTEDVNVEENTYEEWEAGERRSPEKQVKRLCRPSLVAALLYLKSSVRASTGRNINHVRITSWGLVFSF